MVLDAIMGEILTDNKIYHYQDNGRFLNTMFIRAFLVGNAGCGYFLCH
jgi:hypothetical protein